MNEDSIIPSSKRRMAWSDAAKDVPTQSELAAASAPRPALVLVDYQETEAIASPPAILHRPVAVKVSAAAGDLYQLAYEQRVGTHIHQGVVDAHAWNEKWHPMAGLPDRSSGARNPSPEHMEEEEQEHGHDEGSIMMVLQERSRRENHYQNKRKNHVDSHQPEQQQQQQASHRPHLVRPIAVRVQRPQPQQQLQTQHVHVIPADVMPRQDNATLSPLSLPSANSSVDSGPSQTQQRSVHLILPEQQQQHQAPSHILIRQPTFSTSIQIAVRDAHDGVLKALASTRGETVDNAELSSCLDFLKQHYAATAQASSPHSEVQASKGMWLSLTKPLFFGCLGETDQGDPLYTLGRMSFDMFSPTSLVCSLQGSFNQVHDVGADERSQDAHLIVPKSLKDEVDQGDALLQTYNIVTAFTIECDSPEGNAPNKDVHRPIKGIMTTYGYTLPDPKVPSRQSVWITGGRIEPNNDPADQANWKQLFAVHPPVKSLSEQAKFLAVKLLMGATMPTDMNEDGSMEYTFTRPIGGHGTAYVDTLYVDETMRIVQGHRGTIFAFSKMHK
ncbi:hypothetical protein MPSEU_000415300 [Mayamaea pseudoterrestris]|nr:hypothetical protein MPSEU_000415300 [Mayamaea pseudoterrestris]